MLHERHAAVVAGADGDAVRVEQRADVVRVPALEVERDDGDLLRRFAHDGESFDGLEAFGRRGEQDLLVRVRGLLDRHHVFQGDAEGDGAGDVRRTGFETLRGLAESGAGEVDLADHVAAELVRRHGVEQLRAAPEHADAGRSEGLVAGEGVEVATERRDVDLEVRGGLAAVDEHHRARGLGEPGHLGGGIDGAEGVGDVREGDELGAGGEQALESHEVDFAARCDGCDDDLGAGALGDHLPRDDVGVVLEMGEQDLVAGLEVGPAPALGHEVDALGGAAHEDAAPGVLEAEELRDGTAGGFVGGGGLLAQEMDATVDVGVLLGVIALEGPDDDRGLLGGGRVVEIGQRTTAHGTSQDREVLAAGGDVERGHRAERRRTRAGRNREANFRATAAGARPSGYTRARRRPDRR